MENNEKIRAGRIRIGGPLREQHLDQIKELLESEGEIVRDETPQHDGRYLDAVDLYVIHPQFDEIDRDAPPPFYSFNFQIVNGHMIAGKMIRAESANGPKKEGAS